MIRNPVVAGQFYPDTKEALARHLDSIVDLTVRKENAIGAVAPHAGYVYSGNVAGSVFSSIEPKPIYIIMGPNHTGMGKEFALSSSQIWKTPLGEVKVNKSLAEKLIANSKHVEYDDLSHANEHSVEVQIPFLQSLKADFSIVPLVISCSSIDIYKRIGSEIAKSVKDLGLEKEIMIIASSDMTHYEPQKSAQKKDSIAIDAILKLNEESLVDAVSRFNITMCGFAPTAIMIVAAKELGAKTARLIKYETSGDASGDYSSVVGYAGILIS